MANGSEWVLKGTVSRLCAHASVIWFFFLKKTIELSYWHDEISLKIAPPTEICFLHSTFSSKFFRLSKKSSVLFRKIWFAARRLITILSLARSPRDPKSSFRSLLKQPFCCETRVRGQFVANPSPVIFVGVLVSKVRKIKIKIQSQREEALQRLVKHNYDFIALISQNM